MLPNLAEACSSRAGSYLNFAGPPSELNGTKLELSRRPLASNGDKHGFNRGLPDSEGEASSSAYVWVSGSRFKV